jgi:thiol-disulfide isomerase/thioredoxin
MLLPTDSKAGPRISGTPNHPWVGFAIRGRQKKMKNISPDFPVLLCCALISLCGCQAKPVVELQLLDFDGIQQLIAGHKGKIVVLDAWSTSCPPCVKEFPKLVALQRKYGPQRMACVSVSFDYEGVGKPEDASDKVLKFLTAHQATFDNVLSTLESDELLKKFGIYSLPAVFIYDRQGKLAKQFDTSSGAEFTYEDVERYLTSLLDS